MRYIFVILLILISGCSGNISSQKEIVAKVNNCQITKEEFEEEFKQARMEISENTEPKMVFLQQLIDRKLIIQDAEEKSIDKSRGFLKMVEKYWEQALIKQAMEKKVKDITVDMHVSEDDMQKYYNKMLKEGKTDKPYTQVYGEIKREAEKFKEQEMIDKWIAGLRKKADITINYNLIDKKNLPFGQKL